MKNSGFSVFKNAIRRPVVHGSRAYNRDHDVAVFANDFVGRMVITYGRYEREYLENTSWILSRLTGGEAYRNGVCLDIGANIGNHSLYYSLVFNQVIAFEPNPVAYKLLEASVLKNRIDNIDVVTSALGSKKSRQQLSVYDVNLGGGSLRYGAGGRDQDFEVDINIGDDVVRERVDGDKNISFVKLDVEGFEAEVLKGLQETIEKYHPVIAIELNFKTHYESASEAMRALIDLGYLSYFLPIRAKSFNNRYIDFIYRILFGEEIRLLKVSKLDDGKDYLQVFCLATE